MSATMEQEEDDEYEEPMELEEEEEIEYVELTVPKQADGVVRMPSKDDLSRLTPDFESTTDMEEEIIEEEEVAEDSYEEVEVIMDESSMGRYEEVEVAQSDDGSLPPPPDVMASFTGTPPDLGDFVFPQDDYEGNPEEMIYEEEIVVEGIDERSLGGIILMDVDHFTRVGGIGHERDEEKREIDVVSYTQDEIMNDSEAPDEDSVVDFAPCLDVTGSNEEELTERLYGAVQHTLDAWDLHQFDMVAPRPGQERTQSTNLNVGKNNTATSAVPTSSDLYWATRKTVDTIYPENYIVPPLVDPNSVEGEASKGKNAIPDYHKREEVKAEMEDLEKLENLGNSVADYANTSTENFPTVEKDPAIDTDESTSASTSTEVSVTSSSLALSARPLFWAVQGSLETIYPADPGYTAPISMLENEEVDSQTLASAPLPANTEIFSLRLRQYQEERRRQATPSSYRVPQDDDISIPYMEAGSHSSRSNSSRFNCKVNNIVQHEPPGASGSQTVQKSRPVTTSGEESIVQDGQGAEPPEVERFDESSSVTDKPEEEQKTTDEGLLSVGKEQMELRTPTSVRFDKDAPEIFLSEISLKVESQHLTRSKGKARRDAPGKNEKSLPSPEIEAWEDEEAQLSPVREETVYNTDPTKYNRNEVVFERELIVVPPKTSVEDMSLTETVRAVIRNILLALLLVVPFTTGAYLALRK